MNTYQECSGCGVCALVCPTWTQNQDIELTPWGRAKAVQGGATAEDLADSLESCIHCGACSPICPEKIDIHAEDQKLKGTLNLMPLRDDWYEDKFFLSEGLKKEETFARIIKRLIKIKSKGNEMISDYAPFHRKLLEIKSAHTLMSVGEWFIEKKLIQKQLRSGDLYWMDAAIFHLRYEKLVKFYDHFKKTTGCELNWNLQRCAMSLGTDNTFFKRSAQFNWVMLNKNFNRIIVENVDDWTWLKANAPQPVFHVCEMLGEPA